MMDETVIKVLIGYIMVVLSWVFSQISVAADGIVNRGFDAGLSIGLLIIGLIVLGWYHWKYQAHSRAVIEKLVEDKDNKSEQYHVLSLQQISLSQEQIQTNKELRRAVGELTRQIDKL